VGGATDVPNFSRTIRAAVSGRPLLVSHIGVSGTVARSGSTRKHGIALDISLTAQAGGLGYQDTQLLRVGDRAIFQGDDGIHGAYIWSSDGTEQGTVPLISAHAYPNLGPQTMLGAVGTHGYFAVSTSASAGSGDWRLAVTDGTQSGTHVLTDVGAVDITGFGVNEIGGDDTLAFIYTLDNTNGFTKHLSAYAPQTNTLTPLRNTPQFVNNERALVDGGLLFFQASDSLTGIEPWISDGTVAGTRMIQNVMPESLTSAGTVKVSNVTGLLSAPGPTPTVLNGQFYFASYDSTSSSQLWKTDGTAADTVVTATFPSENGNFTSVWPVGVLSGKLLLEALIGTSPPQLWISDGTQAGTTPLDTPPLSQITNVTVIGSKAYFPVQSTPTGSEPWVTDGTQAGTFMLKDTKRH